MFIDRFGELASNYVERPHYPDSLFLWLTKEAPSLGTAWDCACGSGQATHDLARYFDQVIATDASAKQIALARPNKKVIFRQAAAEVSGIPSQTIDLINVGIAAHWFNLPKFYKEAKRVAKPNAIIALMVYGQPTTKNEDINKAIQIFSKLIEPYSSPELRVVRSLYRDMFFPFGQELQLPEMNMESLMTTQQLLSYMRSRSTVTNYIKHESQDPVIELERVLSELQKVPDEPMCFKWPLSGRVARIS